MNNKLNPRIKIKRGGQPYVERPYPSMTERFKQIESHHERNRLRGEVIEHTECVLSMILDGGDCVLPLD